MSDPESAQRRIAELVAQSEQLRQQSAELMKRSTKLSDEIAVLRKQQEERDAQSARRNRRRGDAEKK
jgi:hypothetical protein